jgi:hypothetical protein
MNGEAVESAYFRREKHKSSQVVGGVIDNHTGINDPIYRRFHRREAGSNIGDRAAVAKVRFGDDNDAVEERNLFRAGQPSEAFSCLANHVRPFMEVPGAFGVCGPRSPVIKDFIMDDVAHSRSEGVRVRERRLGCHESNHGRPGK